MAFTFPFRATPWLAAALSLSAAFPAGASPGAGVDDAASTETPHYGKWGFDLSGQDLAVKPGTDFYNYANGLWQNAQVIPPDRIAYGMLDPTADHPGGGAEKR